MNSKATPINLQDFEVFRTHPWVVGLGPRIERDTALADSAMSQLLGDLRDINEQFIVENGVPAFVAIDGRVKAMDSTLRKLQGMCIKAGRTNGMTRRRLEETYGRIDDLCGVRFSCPYHDDIIPAMEELVRPNLHHRGYGIDLGKRHPDKNNLDQGDSSGYRSYHFFVLVPAPTNIFADTEPMLCEVQARTELQHVWAVKSHDLLYRPDEGWVAMDKHIRNDMKAVGENLRAADQWLVSIRDRAKGEGGL